MKTLVLHGREALGPPADPVLEDVAGALREAGHAVELLAIGTSIEPAMAALREAAPDLVFNLTESFGGKSALEASLAAMLNLMGLRYTGSSPAGLVLAGDKILSKKLLGFHGIHTPEFATLYRGQLDHADDLSFPVIVKPPQEDGSLGISEMSVVRDLRELLERMNELQSIYQQPVLIERFIPGREFYVGVLGNAHAEALPVVELRFPADPSNPQRIASFDVKWTDPPAGGDPVAESVVAADLPTELADRMQRIAAEAFQALRLRDYGRIDFRVTDAGDLYVIDVNPNCYLERRSEFAMAAGAAGMSYEELIGRIVELATARYAR